MYKDENIKANEEAVIRENNGPELNVKMYDNIGLDWLYHYGKSNVQSTVMVDDTILQNLIIMADEVVVARRANSKFYHIKIEEATNGEDLSLLINSVGRYRLGDNLNHNIIDRINDKVYNQGAVEKYFVLQANNKIDRKADRFVELNNSAPLCYVTQHLKQLKKDNALIAFNGASMREINRNCEFVGGTLIDGSYTDCLRGHKRGDFDHITFNDFITGLNYTFVPDGKLWILTDIQKQENGKKQTIYKPDPSEYMTNYFINYSNVMENILIL